MQEAAGGEESLPESSGSEFEVPTLNVSFIVPPYIYGYHIYHIYIYFILGPLPV